MILHDVSNIVRERQLAVRREMDRRNISMKVVCSDSGIPSATLARYFPADPYSQPAQMPLGALYRLCDALPAAVLNLLLPDGMALIRVPEGVDYDSVSAECREFLDKKEKAHHPESEEGREIGPLETKDLGENVVRLGAVA